MKKINMNFLITILCAYSIGFASGIEEIAPIVENVRFQQRLDGSLIVDIYFDLTDVDNDIVEISIKASDDDGDTWNLPCAHLTGDIGEGVMPGPEKHVIWDFYKDNPNVSGDHYRVQVTANAKYITDIDENRYRYIKIGNQVWLSKNLRVTHYRNGDPIPNVTGSSAWSNLTTGAYCAYDNSGANANMYGYLYNWYTVNDSRNIAPEGWHVPSDEEWMELESYLGMSQSELNIVGDRGKEDQIGGKLKETGTVHWYLFLDGTTNESKFTALPGGYRNGYDGEFGYGWHQVGLGYDAYFWTSTENKSSSAWCRQLEGVSSAIIRTAPTKRLGTSIRCIRD